MVLQSHAITFGLKKDEQQRFSELLREVEYPAGQSLCVEGAQLPGLFIVHEGRVTVSKRDPRGKDQTLATLDSPTVLGELELISHDPCNATVRADSPIRAHLLAMEEFDRLIELGDSAVSKIVRNIARMVVKRLEKTNARYVDMMDWNL